MDFRTEERMDSEADPFAGWANGRRSLCLQSDMGRMNNMGLRLETP